MTEREVFLSGYCRNLDQARMVEVVLCPGQPPEVDCDYGTCPFEASCPVAAEIRNLHACGD